MRKKILLSFPVFVFIATAVLAGIFFVLSKKLNVEPESFSANISSTTQEEAPSKVEAEKYIIYVDENGFEPTALEINEGETVTFKNRGSQAHWPASNIHPSHKIYPEFDPVKEILSGESWSFKFNKPGIWKFHDHLVPRFDGFITVKASKEAAQPSPANISEARKLPTPVVNIDTLLASVNMLSVAKAPAELKKWLETAGPKEVMEDLLRDSGSGSTIDCHQEAHNIGRMAYDLFGASAFGDGTSDCHSGYYHGAIESFLHAKGTANLSTNIRFVCGSFPTAFGKFECLHGFGHGVLAYEDYDLPKAINICKSLETDYDRSSCYGGLFMENIVTAQGHGARSAHETKWIKITDMHFPCNTLSDYSARYQCYQMQTSWMLYISNYNFSKLVPECLKAPEDMKSVCFKSFGRDAAGHTLRSVPKIIQLCELVPNEKDYYQQCVIGATNVIVDFWGSGLKNQATDLCKAMPDKGKHTCYALLGARLNDIFNSASQKQAVCLEFEAQYRNLCPD